jgi:hypothetical protein
MDERLRRDEADEGAQAALQTHAGRAPCTHLGSTFGRSTLSESPATVSRSGRVPPHYVALLAALQLPRDRLQMQKVWRAHWPAADVTTKIAGPLKKPVDAVGWLGSRFRRPARSGALPFPCGGICRQRFFSDVGFLLPDAASA